MEYISELADGADDCFLCRYRDAHASDAENLVLWRGAGTFALMNRFPYNSGHLLIAPREHVGSLTDVPASGLCELMTSIRDCQELLTAVVKPDGFNVGLNIGRCAGAGLPGHLHVHVVPRWEGDTNFMSVFSGVRVIPQALEATYRQLREQAEKMGLLREAK